MSRVLVVANETVGAEELLAEIRRIEDRRTSRFHVLAPAVAGHHGLGTWNQEGAIQHAQERLDRTLGILRAEGLDAEGQVGDMHAARGDRGCARDLPCRHDRDLDPSGRHARAGSRRI